MKVYILSILFSLSFSLVWSKEYNASFFGIKSDGVTLNTNSIQTILPVTKSMKKAPGNKAVGKD